MKLLLIYAVFLGFMFMNRQVCAQIIVDNEKINYTHNYQDTILVLNYLKKSEQYLNRHNDTRNAKLYADSAYYIAEKIPWKKGIALHWNTYGIISRYLSRYVDAIEYHEIALKLGQELKDEGLIAVSLNNIAVAWRRTDAHEQAIKYHLKALAVAEKSGNITTQAYALNGLGNSYLILQNYDKALDYFNEAYELAVKSGNTESQAINLNNIGDVYLAAGKAEKAYQFFSRSLEMNMKQNSKIGILISYYSIAKSFAARKNYHKAIDYYLKIFENDNIAENKWHFSTANIELAKSYLEIKEYDKAKKALDKGIELAKQIKSTNNKSRAYDYYAQLYEQQGKYEEAYAYLRKFSALKDSLIGDEIQQATSRLQISNQLDKNKAQVKFLEKERENQRIKSRQYLIVSIVGALFILGLTIYFFLLRQYRHKKKSNEELLKLLNEKEILIAEIHHRVKNNLALIAGLIQIQSNNKSTPEQVEALTEIHNRVLTFSLIYENIYDTNDFAAINFKDFLQKYISQFREKFDSDFIEFKLTYSDILLPLKSAIALALICNELIMNSYRHAFVGRDKGLITIDFQKNEDDEIKLHISDNGTGMQNLPDKANSTGYMIINLNAEQLGGKFEIFTAVNEGFKFLLTFKSI